MTPPAVVALRSRGSRGAELAGKGGMLSPATWAPPEALKPRSALGGSAWLWAPSTSPTLHGHLRRPRVPYEDLAGALFLRGRSAPVGLALRLQPPHSPPRPRSIAPRSPAGGPGAPISPRAPGHRGELLLGDEPADQAGQARELEDEVLVSVDALRRAVCFGAGVESPSQQDGFDRLLLLRDQSCTQVLTVAVEESLGEGREATSARHTDAARERPRSAYAPHSPRHRPRRRRGGRLAKALRPPPPPRPAHLPLPAQRYWLSAASSSGGCRLDRPGRPRAPPARAPRSRTPARDGLTLHRPPRASTHPWLAEHALWPAAPSCPEPHSSSWRSWPQSKPGAETIEELTLEAPLVLPEQGAIALQVSVGAADEEGRARDGDPLRPEGTGGRVVPERAGSLCPVAEPGAPERSTSGRPRAPSRSTSTPLYDAWPRWGSSTAPPSRA